MKAIFLTLGFSFTAAVCIVNVSLLWDHTGTGLLLSEILSALTCILILGYLFIPSGIKWILISKLAAFTVMILPLVLDQYRRFISFDPSAFYLPLNVMLIPVCIISIVTIHRQHQNVIVHPRSSNS